MAVPKKRRARRWSPQLRWGSVSLALLFAFTACSNGPGGSGRVADPILNGDTIRGPPVGTAYYHRNHINSSSVITNENGVETARIVYLPFGEFSRENSCGTDVVTAKFTAKEYDEESNLYYYGARYYDPAIGRFVSADPVVPSAEAQSFNRYSYVNNNPIVYVDPTGHFLDFIGDFFNAIGDAFNNIWNAVKEAWSNVKLFFSRLGDYALMTLKGMFTDPAGIIGTILSIALSWATAGGSLLVTLATWAQAAAAGVAATSIAWAAGVRDPVLLSLIGVMAGTAAVSTNTLVEYARSLYAWSVNKLMEAAEGDKIAKWLAPLNSLASAEFVNAVAADGEWVQTPYGAVDPASNFRPINPYPGGPGGPTITFSLGANLPVDPAVAEMVEAAVLASGVDSVNISATTNGTHAQYSRHYSGLAVDINRVNGLPVNASNPAALQLPENFQAVVGRIRENFGPFMNVKNFPNGTVVSWPQVAAAHTTHIHVSSQ